MKYYNTDLYNFDDNNYLVIAAKAAAALKMYGFNRAEEEVLRLALNAVEKKTGTFYRVRVTSYPMEWPHPSIGVGIQFEAAGYPYRPEDTVMVTVYNRG